MGAHAVRLSNVDIDNALKNKDFEVQFQPIFDLGNGALARMETFVRWRHPSLGVLPPGAFISFFETQGRMSELTRYVLAEALAGYTAWRGPFPPGFSINLALTDLSDEAFTSHFTKLLRDRDFPADLVTLECPMPAMDMDIAVASANFARLRKTGARLAIEVRGRANDFLRNIDPFPFDEIKTGGSAILRFARTVRGPGLSAISDLLDIANDANAAITAVGVEDQASLAALRGLGFTAAQGNHLAKVGELKDFRPMRVNEVREQLELAPLKSEDLAALFRTSPPTLDSAEPQSGETEAAPSAPDKPVENGQSAKAAAQEGDTPQAGQSKRDDARQKARTLALAKRARATEARKAAAIKRAKEKALSASENTTSSNPQTENPAVSAAEDPFPPSTAPRDLQKRLEEEFPAPGEAPSDKTIPQAEQKRPEPPQDPKPEAKSPALPPAHPPQTIPERIGKEAIVAKRDKTVTGKQVAAEREEKSSKTQPAEIAAELEQNIPEQMRLAVGATRAYFQPGISVGGQPLNSRMKPLGPIDNAPASSDQTEKIQPQPQETAAEETAPSLLNEENGDDAVESNKAAAETAPEPATQGEDNVQGSLLEEFDAAEAPQPVRRKPKNFLTRKYRIMPTYFWPKSWKRNYRRWKTTRAEDNVLEAAE